MSAAKRPVILWDRARGRDQQLYLGFQTHCQFWCYIQCLGVQRSSRPASASGKQKPNWKEPPFAFLPSPRSPLANLPSYYPLSSRQTQPLHLPSPRKPSWVN